ncbi:MAG TPA: protein translocase subunit SecF [Candidatus Andersenbacteria bacterium]|nr:protein translocase subunit SecF [Candidatus Andersenbacteria bacterium]
MMKNPTVWMWISALTIVASIAVIVIIKPIWGIDFLGGSLIEVEANPQDAPKAQEGISKNLNISATALGTRDNTIIIRTPVLDDNGHKAIIDYLKEESLMKDEERSFESIGPTIGKELREKSIYAVVVVLIILIIYLAYTFRSMDGFISPWKFGLAAIYALVHDLFLVTAFFVIFGKIYGTAMDTLFVTAQLAIFGYSVNDTIVIFDRLRSEHIAARGKSLIETLDRAIKVTLGRSLNISFCILLTLLALLVFGGSSIRWFIVALTIGTITGTYSSLFVAPPLLYFLAKRKR